MVYPTVMKALVIGNSRYTDDSKLSDLPHCKNDAIAVADLLKNRLHF